MTPECLECKKPMPWVGKETAEEHEIFCSHECCGKYLGSESLPETEHFEEM